MEPLANEIRRKKPSMALEADYKNSRRNAIYLFCLECMGGSSSDVASCKSFTCSLWQYRKNNVTKMVPPGIVSKEELLEIKENKTTDAQREAGKRLGNLKKK